MKQTLKEILKYILFLLVAMIVLIYAMFQGGFVSWFLFYSTITVLGLTLLMSLLPVKGFKVERVIQPTVAKGGDDLLVTVTVRKSSFQPFFYMHVFDHVSADLGEVQNPSAFFFFSFQKKFQYRYSIHNVKRGQYEFDKVELIFGDLFGFFEKRKAIVSETIVNVYPRYQKIREVPHGKQVESIEGKLRAKELGEERNLSSVRQYIPGDRLTSIDWKQSARSTQLMTKEFESFRGEGIVIAFDPYLSAQTEEMFEKSIELTASLLVTFMESQGSVQLAVRLDDWVSRVVSSNQLYKGLELLAQIEGTGKVLTFGSVYEQWRGATVYFVCAELSKDMLPAFEKLRQQQISLQVCLVRNNGRNQWMINDLERLGIKTHIVQL
ncbi:DUF58 domain-containing protein [Alkalihalobacillus sp. 1P02AB]|uniref:DUF58 domain-containing protein n=1 Tax=Alkalihalobacillus sp. 1P02AB TaxID=3132260 RepID=UPI0039A6FCF5